MDKIPHRTLAWESLNWGNATVIRRKSAVSPGIKRASLRLKVSLDLRSVRCLVRSKQDFAFAIE